MEYYNSVKDMTITEKKTKKSEKKSLPLRG